jgi:ABC-2 type transport system ATP-binding protein
MQQRFSIVAALVNEPELVFFDEPTAGLDPDARQDLWRIVREVREAGATVVLTTHYMEEAEALCDRVMRS